LIEECHRVLKKGGTLLVKLPSNLPNIDHQSSVHDKDYFWAITNEHDKSGLIPNKLFDKIYVKGSRRSLLKGISLYIKFRNWLLGVIYSEWEYKLKKR
jgi:ubiquinone/menaquinone biosynthesis C-methylase UbiE